MERYRQLFADKYMLNPVDGKYYPFPTLDVSAVTRVDLRPEAFLVHATPPSGVSIEARVDRAGQWTEVVRVVFSAE